MRYMEGFPVTLRFRVTLKGPYQLEPLLLTMLYFFSYARADDTAFLEKFYNDLREAVRSKTGASDTELIDFRDTKSIEPGKAWPKVIGEALRSCKVFVYLHTTTYFTRDGCGREFELAYRRFISGHFVDFNQASCIQPVYWDGIKSPENVPPEILQIQLTHDAYGKAYNEGGMLQLVRTSYNTGDYWQVINQMAERIQKAADSAPLPHLAECPVWDKIPPLFPISSLLVSVRPPDLELTCPPRSPRYARFVWVVGKREEISQVGNANSLECYDPDGIAEEWRPFYPTCEDPARLIATGAALQAKLTYVCEQLPDDYKKLQHVINKASAEYTPVVVVIDLWSLCLEKYKAVVKILDKGILHNCAVICAWNLESHETQVREYLRNALSEVFPIQFYMPDTQIVFNGIENVTTFKDELEKLLTKYAADINRGRRLHAARQLPERLGFNLLPQLGSTSGTHCESANE